jgi:predicted phosphate transport protein (TIGR00153 family)
VFGSKKKDAAFFDAFSRHAATSVAASKMLVEMFTHMKTSAGGVRGACCGDGDPSLSVAVDETTRTLAAKIKQAETAGDTITHETVKRLHENWITPLDRDDIHGLVSRLDDVLDMIEAVAERVVLFKVHLAPPEAVELAGLLVLSCEALVKAVALLPTMSKASEILALCVEVNRLENVADQVHRKALGELFEPGNDPLMVMKWRDIFDSLESATDRCEDVANIVEGVVLEYA